MSLLPVYAQLPYPIIIPCYLKRTLFRRLLQNPAYYDLEDASPEGLSAFMSDLVEEALTALADSGCVMVSACVRCCRRCLCVEEAVHHSETCTGRW